MRVDPPGPDARVYSPTELNREVRLHLEAGFPRLWVAAEISNLSRPGSGHWYFTLKDAGAQLRCAMFRSANRDVGFEPGHGQQVLVRGRLSLYEARGDYQFIADAMLEAGAGALQQAFEALKKKLEAEGLFDPALKRPLPAFPIRIAVVTSPTGAAVRDVLETLRLRWPAARVRIYPAQVQGEQAPAQLIRALRAADRQGFAQVILLVRGGGSLEDLWAFNDEDLARTLRDLTVPVVCGVGHETDFSIADFVADQRAATPTAAAQAATPDGPALGLQADRLQVRLERAMAGRLQQLDQRLDFLLRRITPLHPARRLARLTEQRSALHRRLVRRAGQEVRSRMRVLDGLAVRLRARHPGRNLDELQRRLGQARGALARAGRHLLERNQARLVQLARTLHSVSPLAVLGRGYAVLEDSDGRVLTRREDFSTGMAFRARIRDFRIDATVRSVSESPDTDSSDNETT